MSKQPMMVLRQISPAVTAKRKKRLSELSAPGEKLCWLLNSKQKSADTVRRLVELTKEFSDKAGRPASGWGKTKVIGRYQYKINSITQKIAAAYPPYLTLVGYEKAADGSLVPIFMYTSIRRVPSEEHFDFDVARMLHDVGKSDTSGTGWQR